MSLYRKLFIAATIVGAGLGVAILLGEPAQFKQAFVTVQPAVQSSRGGERFAKSASSDTWAAGNVQLVPETTSTTLPQASLTAPALSAPMPDLAPMSSVTPPTAANVDAAAQFTSGRGATSPTSISSELPVRARLRSECPRPVGNEPRSPATIRRLPPGESGAEDAQPSPWTNQVAGGWNVPATLPAGVDAAEKTTPATSAAYLGPVETSEPALPSPRPNLSVGEQQRSHIVIDGDSLERLANRYLDDPRRSREIYDLNRELLSSPDLLPIGVELKIPPRTSATSWDRSGSE